eukprot:749769-Hanusia_phi.AAC.4
MCPDRQDSNCSPPKLPLTSDYPRYKRSSTITRDILPLKASSSSPLWYDSSSLSPLHSAHSAAISSFTPFLSLPTLSPSHPPASLHVALNGRGTERGCGEVAPGARRAWREGDRDRDRERRMEEGER